MRYGVSQSGPMDWVRFQHALRLAGEGTVAAVEFGLTGLTLHATGTVALAITGPGFRVLMDGREPVGTPARVVARDEDVTIAGGGGMWGYCAVAGLAFGPPVLGSFATNVRTRLGARDFTVTFPVSQGAAPPFLAADVPLAAGPIGVLPGPQRHLFPDETLSAFEAGVFRLTDKLDRMGYRLEGPPLKASTHDIISDGIVEGAIQVPGNGQPIVLCADRQPTGGYPKIGVVAAADMPRLTQLGPGASVRFRLIDAAEARRRRAAIATTLAAGPLPRVRTDFPSQFLAERNLISGVVAGRDADNGIVPEVSKASFGSDDSI